jgi:hypothetical protein
MTAVEHIIAWIESSAPEYERLCKLELSRKTAGPQMNSSIAWEAFSIASSAYRQMVRGGDAYMGEHSPMTILDAAKALLEWELEA